MSRSAVRAPSALVAAVLALLAAAPPARTGEAPGSLDGVLARAGLSREDLAVGSPPDGLGHPAAAGVSFLRPGVEGLRRDPLRLPVLGRNLLAAAAGAAEGEPPAGGRLARHLSVFVLHPRLAGFRGHPVPLASLPDAPGVLTAVLERLRTPGARELESVIDHRVPPVAPPWPAASAEERRLPATLRHPLAELLATVWQSGRAVARSWAGLGSETLARAVAPRGVSRQIPGGTVAWPALARAARVGGDTERAFAALRLAAAVERAATALADRRLAPDWSGWEAETPWGRVLVASRGPDVHTCAGDCLLIVEPGGDDRYRGSAAGAMAPERPVAAVLDLGGDDRYGADGEIRAAQGAGRGGVGVLVDVAGDDVYRGGDGVQGSGLLGYGVLWDRGGEDRFEAGGGAQGSGVLGGGLLVSGSGDDRYRILGEGQGFGGPGGAGALVDLAGADGYRAEPDPAVARGRADYHSDGRVAASNAQGAGVGRRGDLTDGEAWAGGIGVLADLAGDDRYTAGNFAQGMGYFYGTGMLLDAAGDDRYRSVYFSQGSGAHFSLALLWDGGGDDRHLLSGEAGASLGYGWDFAASVLVDGGGDDLYRAETTSLGVAARRSVGIVLEAGGDDRYQVPSGGRLLGAVDGNPAGWRPGEPVRAAATSNQVGLFVDLGGEDRYAPGGSGEGEGSERRGDARSWRAGSGARVSRGVDVGAGLDLEVEVPGGELAAWVAGLEMAP